MTATRRNFLVGLGALGLAGCGTRGTDATADEEARIAAAIAGLSPSIDREEAARAARIGLFYPLQLKAEYRIEDPPLIHNVKVNSGRKPRGLCWHWAEDMQTRLDAEGFETLVTHRAIANAFTPLLIDHSTVIISAVGDRFDEGIILDPWRYGGRLFWAPTLADTRYTWIEREEVFARKRALGAGQDDPSSEPLPARN